MKNDNIMAFARLLQTTDALQTRGHLGHRNDDGEHYCCLGLGPCKLIPDRVDVEWVDDGAEELLYVDNFNGIAPLAFVDWLGLTIPYLYERVGEFGIKVDWDGTTDRDGVPLAHTQLEALAGLNDAGFTFAQIGDLIAHFGLQQEVDA